MAKEEKTKDGLTPLMRQHQQIKTKYPDAVLLFRVGDFYETFGADAVIASKVLGIVLTKRANGQASHVELAGFPHHSLDSYLHKLVKAGYRVAICDQLEDPKKTKTIVKRGVTEVVSPGVTVNDKLLENDSNNFLASVFKDKDRFGLAFADVSTGEFLMAEGDEAYVDKLIQSFRPSEILISKKDLGFANSKWSDKAYVFGMNDWIYDQEFALESFISHFQTQSLKGYGVADMPDAITAGGAIMQYLKDNELPKVSHISRIQRIVHDEFLWMDRYTMDNLELLHSRGHEDTSLFAVLNHTDTPMGARMLRRWITFPLTNLNRIEERQNSVEYIKDNKNLFDELPFLLKSCGDPERIMSKIPLRKINPREVLQIARTLESMSQIKNILTRHNDQDYLIRLADTINPCDAIRNKILSTIQDDPPALVSKGQVIKEGVHEELDEYRNLQKSGKNYLLEIQKRESENSGINSLKIGFNNVFGYYLEVTNAHKDKVPDNWIRKQTLTNAERYVTEELKEYEEKIARAEERIQDIEQKLYEQLVDALLEYVSPIQINAQSIAILDCLHSFVISALQYDYHKPNVNKSLTIDLKASRHPVIEKYLPLGDEYVPNDVYLDNDKQQIIILTGPNMSGKSALLRQTALCVLMAHMGSYVPCREAHIGLTDKIFTRVGASDNMSAGESTFMVEMNETAGIVNNVSERSLVLLDEIGRGTSTYDGISIAWAIVEFLHESASSPKTLFATHYHELNELEKRMERIRNFHISHAEVGNKIIFTHKLKPGGSHHSFGIHVAQMAGMPSSLLSRAEEVLKILEANRDHPDLQEVVNQIPSSSAYQLNFFDSLSEDLSKIKDILQAIDVDTITPVEALLKLNEMKKVLLIKQQ